MDDEKRETLDLCEFTAVWLLLYQQHSITLQDSNPTNCEAYTTIKTNDLEEKTITPTIYYNLEIVK